MTGKIPKKFDKMSADEKEQWLLQKFWAAERELEYWKKMLAKLRGSRPFDPLDYERPDVDKMKA